MTCPSCDESIVFLYQDRSTTIHRCLSRDGPVMSRYTLYSCVSERIRCVNTWTQSRRSILGWGKIHTNWHHHHIPSTESTPRIDFSAS